MNHEIVEKNIGLMAVLVVIVISLRWLGRNRAVCFSLNKQLNLLKVLSLSQHWNWKVVTFTSAKAVTPVTAR